ncbi:unnamed protein product [Vicia faba]|uniref:Uncharacterized protein n=1 Tax=Vicia faba TaxID=3906 RepID=A0AAV1B5M1_VICFA|nr:unnamed protein product [Vicia faba]
MPISAELSGLKGQLSEQDKSTEELVGKLEAAVMDSLLVRDLGFDKDKIQVLFLHLGLDFYSLGYFKVVWDRQLVIEEELETFPELENVEDFPLLRTKTLLNRFRLRKLWLKPLIKMFSLL